MDLKGRTLGVYQIMEEVGRGGMASVYRAYQSSLNRYVAIKVLPPQLAYDEEFVQRFLREAQAAASLSHPNIVVVHDVGEQGGLYYIVMEFLEGQTLKDLIQREGPLSPVRAARILEQVAAALDYAHQRGFVHRDIKPANIFVGPDDRVKLTDFGIAKAVSEAEQLTRTGMLVGTPEYMSPEQAAGTPIDHRTDLYALGVVLYQMLTGQAPFQGTTPHSILHAIIYEPPRPPRQVNPGLSPAIESVLLKSLAKNPKQRFQRGAEMVVALDRALRGVSVPGGQAPADRPARPQTSPRRSPWIWMLGGAAAVLLLVLGMLIAMMLSGGSLISVAPATEELVARVSPTAMQVAETPAVSATPAPRITETSGPTDMPVPPTETSVPPTEAPLPPSPAFGKLAFASNRDGNQEIYVVNLAGGGAVRLTNNGVDDWLPDWSPDGSRLAFTSFRTGSYDLWVMNDGGGGASPVVTTGAWDDYARWAPDGQRIALSTTADSGGVPNSEIFVRLADGSLKRRTDTPTEDQWPDWSPDGRIIYTEGKKGTTGWDIYVMNGDGSDRRVWLGGPGCDVQPTWSPDGNWIAFVRIQRDTNANGLIDELDAGDIWVARANGEGLRQLTSGPWALTPAWSPDSEWVAFTWVRDSNGNGHQDDTDASDILAAPRGGGEPVPLVTSSYGDWGPSWTW